MKRATASILWQRSLTMPKSLRSSANTHTYTSNGQAFVLPLCYRQYLQSCFVCAIVDALCALVVLFPSHNEYFFFIFNAQFLLSTYSLSCLCFVALIYLNTDIRLHTEGKYVWIAHILFNRGERGSERERENEIRQKSALHFEVPQFGIFMRKLFTFSVFFLYI